MIYTSPDVNLGKVARENSSRSGRVASSFSWLQSLVFRCLKIPWPHGPLKKKHRCHWGLVNFTYFLTINIYIYTYLFWVQNVADKLAYGINFVRDKCESSIIFYVFSLWKEKESTKKPREFPQRETDDSACPAWQMLWTTKVVVVGWNLGPGLTLCWCFDTLR